MGYKGFHYMTGTEKADLHRIPLGLRSHIFQFLNPMNCPTESKGVTAQMKTLG